MRTHSIVAKPNENDIEETDITERVLLSLVFDVSLLHESVERVRVQVCALAKQHGVDPIIKD